MEKVEDSFLRIKKYCEDESFMGWDPFDGLNSKVFQSLPFIKNNRIARLIWIQLFKRNPINLRKFMMVPKGHNPKGLALFYWVIVIYISKIHERSI